LQWEDKIFWDPDVAAHDRLAKDMLRGKWPYQKSSHDRPTKPDLDPFDKMCKEVHESDPGYETPYQQLQRARASAEEEQRKWQKSGSPALAVLEQADEGAEGTGVRPTDATVLVDYASDPRVHASLQLANDGQG